MKTLIKFECPGCGQLMEGDSDAEFQQCTCPICGNEFFPKPLKSSFQITQPADADSDQPHITSAPKIPQPESDDSSKLIRNLEVRKRRDSIRRNANAFIYVAIGFTILGLLALLVALTGFGDSDGDAGSWIACVSFWGFALWLYLIGQVIHIRANTEH